MAQRVRQQVEAAPPILQLLEETYVLDPVDQVLVVLVAEEALAQLGQPVLSSLRERTSFFCLLCSRMWLLGPSRMRGWL